MRHSIFVLITILLVIGGLYGVFALKQVEPYSKLLSENDFVGKAVPGSELQLVFSKENEKFDSFEITNTLPPGFNTSIVEEPESFKLIINVPVNAVNSQYRLSLTFSNTNNVLSEEKIDVYFSVDNELLFASMDNFSQEAFIGEQADYGFTLINNSDASAKFIISSSLPSSWYSTKEITIKPMSIIKDSVSVFPKISGERKFWFSVDYSGKEKEFDVFLKSNPTLESKFESALSGLPFYSFSLIPNYLFNGLMSLLF